MPRTRTTEYTVFFRNRERGGDLGAVLDMIRYDSAKVVTWTSPFQDETRWSVTLRCEGSPVTDRWLSFGLRPVNIRES